MTRDRRILGIRINIKAHFDVWFISFSGLMFTLINDYSYNFNIKTVRITEKIGCVLIISKMYFSSI